MQNFRTMRIWSEAMALAETTYDLTRQFPDDERFGLVTQMRRAAVSISSNIAEGAGRAGSRSLAFHLSIAAGSASELDSQMELASRLGFVDQPTAADFHKAVDRLRAGLFRFEQRVRSGAGN